LSASGENMIACRPFIIRQPYVVASTADEEPWLYR
jgi:hypothetical protein